MSRGLGILAALAALVNAVPAAADEGSWTFSAGVDYTRGDYGETANTTIVTVPLGAAYGTDRWSATLIVPFVRVEGPGTIVPSGLGGGGPLGGLLGGADAASPIAPSGGVDETGLGDVSLALSVVPFVMESGTQVTVSGRVKVPTADEDRRLGTGDASAAVAGGLRQAIGQRWAVFGSLGYEQSFAGDSGVLAGVGAEGYVGAHVLVGTTLDFAEAASDLRRDSAQASAYVGVDVSATTRLLAYGSAGLTDTSPDVGAGLRLVFTRE